MQQPMYNGGAQIANLPYNKQLILDAGIPLFEIEKKSKSRLDSNDFGYRNCAASKNEMSENVGIGLRWFEGKNAYIRFSRNSNNQYLAYCPDDPEWFNRTRLCSAIQHVGYRVLRYYDKDGYVTPGAQMTEELNFIGEMLHDWVAKVDGGVVFRSKNILEVEEFIAKKRMEGIAVQGPKQELIQKLQLILKEAKHHWVFSPAFQQEVKPEMIKRINQKFNRDLNKIKQEQPEIEAAVSKMIPQIISNMSLKQLNNIMKQKVSDQKEGVHIIDGELYCDGVALDNLNLTKIRSVAVRKFKMKTTGKTREELIDEINELVAQETEDVNDIAGPPSEEEIKNRKAAGLAPLETIESI